MQKWLLPSAIIVTALWIIGVVAFANFWPDGSSSLALNEIGDFVAGAAAPLAFFWLIVAVLLQREQLKVQAEELKASTAALNLQVTETRALVEQNAAAVDVAKRSFDEQIHRAEEDRIDRLIDTLAMRIVFESGSMTLVSTDGSTIRIFELLQHRHYPDEVFRIAQVQLGRAYLRTQNEIITPHHSDNVLQSIKVISRGLDAILDKVRQGQYPVLQARIEMLELEIFRKTLHMFEKWVLATPAVEQRRAT